MAADQERRGRIMRPFILMLGHGRLLEMYLIGVKLLIGFSILLPKNRPQVVALGDLLWVPDYWLSAPFLLLGTIQLIGIILNVRGVQSSWVWRSVGASIGICLWSWLISKSLLIGAFGTGALPFWVMSFLASVVLLWKGMNRLPIPGAPGAL